MQINLNNLSDLEKLNLINTIWESIEDKDNSIPVDENHIKVILDRVKTEGKTIPWETSKKRINTCQTMNSPNCFIIGKKN
jgi:hypothetical protein